MLDQVNDLTKLHTKQLLRLKSVYYRELFTYPSGLVTAEDLRNPYFDYCPFDVPIGFTATALKAELAKREHIQSQTKAERRKSRQEKANS